LVIATIDLLFLPFVFVANHYDFEKCKITFSKISTATDSFDFNSIGSILKF
jgi:hypothetical protein